MNANPTSSAMMANLVKAAIPLAVSAATAAVAGAAKRRRKPRRRRSRRSGPRDVELQAPVSRGRIVRNRKLPSVRVRHREYLQDVTVSSGVDARWTLPINPAESFPWLQNVAKSFEKYKLHSLRFEYVTATATSTTGAIALAPEYDPDDLDYSLNKQQLYMFEGIVRGPLWSSLSMNFRTDGRIYFNRNGPEDGTLKFHDPGQLIIDVTSPNVTGVVGELWAEYDVTFMIPEYELNKAAHTTVTNTTTWVENGGTGHHYFPLDIADTTIAMALPMIGSGGGYIRSHCYGFTAGVYMLSRVVTGTALTTSAAPSVYVGSGSYVGPVDAITKLSETANAAGTSLTTIYRIEVGPTYTSAIGYEYSRTSTTPVKFNFGATYGGIGAPPTAVTFHLAGPLAT